MKKASRACQEAFHKIQANYFFAGAAAGFAAAPAAAGAAVSSTTFLVVNTETIEMFSG